MLRDAHYRAAAARGHGVGYVSPHDDPSRSGADHLPESLRGRAYYVPSGNGEEEWRVAIATGDRAPEFDLEEAVDRPRVRLSDYRGRSNVLLVFHPFAFTPVCAEEAQDLQENLDSFRNANTEIVFVSCDTSAARQAWKAGARRGVHLRVGLLVARERPRTTASSTRRRARPIRGTFLIDRDGVVIWSLVSDPGRRRTEMVPGSLGTLRDGA